MECLKGVIILAGGKSDRMFFPKAYLLYGGETFLKKIVDEYYYSGIKHIYVVLNDNFCNGKWAKYIEEVKLKATIIKNANPELGRFHSLKLGIKEILNDSSAITAGLEFCFIQNIDNPFINKEIIKKLMSSRNSAGYTSPQFMGKNGHPVLISKKIIEHINNLPDENYNLRTILSGFKKRQIKVNNDNILININTADDYAKCISQTKLPEEKKSHHITQAEYNTEMIPSHSGKLERLYKNI